MSNTPPSTSNFRDYVQDPTQVPTWLRGPIGSRILYSIAAQFDALVDACAYAIRARFPATAPPDAFPWLTSDRQIDQGFQEPLSGFVVRLVMWLDLWRLAGSSYGVLLALLGYVAPDQISMETVSNTGAWDFYAANAGASPPQDGLQSDYFVPPVHTLVGGQWNWDNNPWWWWRFWVVLYPDSGLWNQGTTWGSFKWGDGTMWGLGGPGASVNTAPNLIALIKKWKTAGAFVPTIILAFDSSWFLVTSPSGKLPDGTWGNWWKVVVVGGRNVYVASRSSTASYIEGPFI